MATKQQEFSYWIQRVNTARHELQRFRDTIRRDIALSSESVEQAVERTRASKDYMWAESYDRLTSQYNQLVSQVVRAGYARVDDGVITWIRPL